MDDISAMREARDLLAPAFELASEAMSPSLIYDLYYRSNLPQRSSTPMLDPLIEFLKTTAAICLTASALLTFAISHVKEPMYFY